VLYRTALVTALALVASAPATAMVERVKPTDRDYDRVQLAGRAALGKLGLVIQRGCDYTNLKCLDKATTAEASAYAHAASVEMSVAAKLSTGKCKTTMLARAKANAKHVSDVVKARRAWHARQFAAAQRFYHAPFDPGARLDGLFVRYC
jgi:hypothetical protein